MEAVPSPIGALHRCHSHISDFTRSLKCPPEKQACSDWPVQTLYKLVCNKWNTVFCIYMIDFCRPSHIFEAYL